MSTVATITNCMAMRPNAVAAFSMVTIFIPHFNHRSTWLLPRYCAVQHSYGTGMTFSTAMVDNTVAENAIVSWR